tara:strand:+ start:165 stop:680 length:516 start_codon:yes stop_codon:yes gene_type:complete
MAKAFYVKKARKDNPAVKAGEPYYWWAFRYGGKHYSATRPRPSQLTGNEKLSNALVLGEELEDLTIPEAEDTDALKAAFQEVSDQLNNIADQIDDVVSQYQESADNIRESFSESALADEFDEKVSELEDWAENVREAANSIPDIEIEDDELESAIEEAEGYLEPITCCPIG